MASLQSALRPLFERFAAGRAGTSRRSTSHPNKSLGLVPKNRSAAVVPSLRSGKEATLPSPPGRWGALLPLTPLRTQRKTFALLRSSLSNAARATRLNCLHDTRLEPTDIAMGCAPINPAPVHGYVGGRASQCCHCRHLPFLFMSVDQVLS